MARCPKMLGLIGACAALLALGGTVRAGTITSPISVSSPQGDFGGAFALVNMINQSGLSINFTSGVTDFNTYIAAGPTHSSPGNGTNSGFASAFGEPQDFNLSFASPVTIDKMAFWATDNIGSVTQFQLFGDSGQIGGTFNASAFATPASAQVFSFDPTTTEHVRIHVLSDAGGTGLESGIGEVAFDVGVPEPASFALFGMALVGAIGYYRRRKAAV